MAAIKEMPREVIELADRLDNLVVNLSGGGPLLTPALAVLIGRYVAFEAGRADRIGEGLQIVWTMARLSAIERAVQLYAAESKDDPEQEIKGRA